jgi:hypothetical protein
MNLDRRQRHRRRPRCSRRALSVPLPPAHTGADRRHPRQRAARAARARRRRPARQVELAEISGSDTFVHVDTPIGELVAQLTGVHRSPSATPSRCT